MPDSDNAYMDERSRTTGRCLCGEVRYEINQPVSGTGYCHCRICQRFASQPVNAWASFPAEAIRFTKNDPKYYKSSLIAQRGFCVNCGTSLTYQVMTPKPSDQIVIHTMTLDNPEDYAPTWHGGIESQMPWHDIDDDLPRTKCMESTYLQQAWKSVGITDPADWVS